ncbi:putative RNA-directed DNA polymerase [Lupinus albus]|uniref:Putative RNA-directed DNA polymerase n=1 Tax=Lupinus albus TaxID=3870 RepID=A0A6A4QD86_LUPAL|nr:putative RNA-directed DNA polymerase [Lupinus albus]
MRLLEKLGHKREENNLMYCDNSSTIQLSKHSVFHGKSKHIDVKFHFLRDLVNEGIVKLKYCNTQNQIADIMTKPLKKEQFIRLRGMLGLMSAREIS